MADKRPLAKENTAQERIDEGLTYREGMRLRAYRRDMDFSYSCGVFPTCELLEARPELLRRIVVTERSFESSGVAKLKEGALKLGIPFVTDDRTVSRLYPKDNVLAIGVFEKKEERPLPGTDHAVLVNPSDMGNLGTIMRTMAAFEIFDLCIVRPCCDPFDPKTVRSSMGALFRLRVSTFDSFDGYLKACDGGPRSFFPFMLDGRPLESVDFPEDSPSTLIFGNEASGLPGSFLKTGTPVRIMHADTVDSLNLPVAAAIGIYKLRKHNYC